MLHAEGLEDRRPVLPRDVLEVEGEAVDELPVAEREELHGGPVASTASPITSMVPTARLSAACRCARLSIAWSRLRYRAASSKRSSAAAARIRCSSARRIGRVSPERNSITPSMISP